MALADKRYTRMYSTTGGDSDKVDSSKITRMESKFTSNEYLEDDALFEQQGMLIVQMQKLIDEFDEIRRHVINDVVGQAGADGAQGSKGDKGDAGNAGANGSNGSNGSTGARGPAGNTGARGADGAAGTTDASQLDASTLPTSKPKTTGLLWNNRGIVNIS